MQDWVWDCETYPNCFSVGFFNTSTKEAWVFEISDRKDQRKNLFNFLRKVYRESGRLVGFNSIGFDYPVLHYLLKKQDASVFSIYKKAMSIIEAQDEDKFKHLIKPEEFLINQLDLYKIHHFDNRNKSTGLKVLEFNMRSDSIEDLPFPAGKDLSFKEIGVLIDYMQHDILQTYEFYKYSLPMIRFREELTKKYNRDFLNHNDTKIGKDYFIMRLEEKQKGCCYKIDSNGKRKIQQTRRKFINLKDCIFPYVSFERPEFNAILNWFKSQKITETKGVFTELLEHELGDVAKYAKLKKKQKKLKGEPSDKEIDDLKKEKPLCWIEERTLKSQKLPVYYVCWNVVGSTDEDEGCLNVIVDDFQFDFGVGGIHGSLRNTIIEENEDYEIVDADVSSMYPNLAISNRQYPEHLGELFCDIYKDMYIQRKSYSKKTAENAMLKLALNGTYGDSNNEFSPFYDPKFTMSITINGQLSLCMLAEALLKIDGLKLIQANTDGLTVYLPRSKRGDYDLICKQWQDTVKLELEFAEYKKMCIRDVNNYIALYKDGKIKSKGAYEYQDLDKLKEDPSYPFAWHKNHSCLIVPMAAEAALVKGKDVESFIKEHQNIMDFMLRIKVPRSNKVITVDDFGGENREQNICRYYVSNEGVKLIKVMPALEGCKTHTLMRNENTGEEVFCKNEAEVKKFSKLGYSNLGLVDVPNDERPQEIEAGWKVTICNNIKSYKGGINYDYYIQEAKKLVECMSNFQLKQVE